MSKTKIFTILISISFPVFSLIFLTIFYIFAWTEPTTAPPGGNVPAPLHTGPAGQVKIGGLILNTGGAPIGLIVDKGNVGIGTTTPPAKLYVRTTDTTTPPFQVEALVGNPGEPKTVFYIQPKTGNVGIGTTSPLERLDVAGAIRIGDTPSPCDASRRGTIKFISGAPGTTDCFAVCLRRADGTFTWRCF